jgi:DNA mismatch endonuclease (patch repair protein)
MIEDSLIPIQQDQLIRSALRFANKIDKRVENFFTLSKDCISAIGAGTGSSVTASGKSLAFDGTEFIISGSATPGIGTYISERNSVNDIINAKAYIEQYNYMPDGINSKTNSCIICSKPTSNKKYCSRNCMYKSMKRGDQWKDPILREKKIKGLKDAHKRENWYINITEDELKEKLSSAAYKNWSNPIYRNNRAKSLDKTMEILRKDPNYQQAVKDGLKRAWSDPQKREHYFNGMKMAKKETEIEKMMREEIEKKNLPFKYKSGVGHFCIPDHVSYKYKIAVFDDGDYWHINPSKNYKNLTKAQLHNLENDKKVNEFLEKRGWFVLRFWESEIKKDIKKCINKIETVLLLSQETLLVHPLAKTFIEKLPHFTSLMHYGEPILQEGLMATPGKFGDILGLDAFASTNCPTGSAYVLSRGRTTNILGQYSPMGMFVERRPITTGIKALEERDSVGVYITARYAPVVLMGNTICAITGIGSV